MTTPLGTLEVLERDGRRVRVARTTRETEIELARPRRHRGGRRSRPGVGFYDHLLTSLAHHALIDLEVRAKGDLHVDEHHTVEDVALVLGAALAEALGDRAGIRRFGDASVPMDESVATAVIDVGGRPYAVIDLPFRASGRARSRSSSWSTRSSRSREPRGRRSTSAGPAATTTTSPRRRSRPWPARSARRASRIRGAPASLRPRARSG